MKTIKSFLLAGVALFLSLLPSYTRAEKSLVIVLDCNMTMKQSGAVKTTVSYVNTLIEGYAKKPELRDLSFRLEQVYAEKVPGQGVKCSVDYTFRRVGESRPFEATRGRALKDSPVDMDATRPIFQAKVTDWASKNDGVLFITTATGATAVNLGEGFSRLVKPSMDKYHNVDENALTSAIRDAIEDFISFNSVPDFKFKSLLVGTAKTKVAVPFEFTSENIDGVVVDTGIKGASPREFADNLKKGSFEVSFPEAGTYVVTATARRRDTSLPPVKVTVRVEDPVIPTVSRLVVLPEGGVYLPDEVSFSIGLADTDTATVDFGDGTKANYRTGAPDLRHAYKEAGDFKVTVTPMSGRAKTTVVTVKTPSVKDVFVAPEEDLTTATPATVSFSVDGAPSASVDFGDGTDRVVVKTKNGSASVDHRYAAAGSYSIRVAPVNGGRRFDAAAKSKPVVVGRAIPATLVSIIPLRPTMERGKGPAEFKLTLQNVAKATVDFGDETPTESFAAGTITHEYDRIGSFTVTAKALSEDGAEHKNKTPCTIQIVEPELPAPTCTITADETTEMGSSWVMDLQFADTQSATVSFSDAEGEPAAIEIDDIGAAEVRHAFKADGECTVTISMVNGPKTGTAKYTVQVAKPEETFGAISVTVQGPEGEDLEIEDNGTGNYKLEVGQLITLVVKQRNVNITVDYGDPPGETDKGSTTSHAYQQSGHYTVEIRGKGKISGASKGSKTITVDVVDHGFPKWILLPVLVALGFCGLLATRPKGRLAVTKSSATNFHDFSLIGHACQVKLENVILTVKLRGNSLWIRSSMGGVKADGKTLGSEPLEITKSSFEVSTSAGTWMFERIDRK